MGTIIAMGGGELREGQTLPLDHRVIELTGKAHPNALFIPTASGDAEGYWDTFRAVYGDQLGCNADVLYLIKPQPDHAAIKAKIDAADMVYVGGGNTLKMMRLWRRLGVDDLLREAHQRGVVLSGLSAGAICWFAHGHSDSLDDPTSDTRRYTRVSGLGLMRGTFCPHLDGEKRFQPFTSMIAQYGGFGLAADDCCALEIVDDSYRVLTSRDGAKAYTFRRRGGQVVTQAIPQQASYRPLADLFTP